MKEKLVKVNTPNKMLYIKGKLSRTPLQARIKFEEELNLLVSSMIHQGIDFTVEDYEPKPKVEKEKPIQAKKVVKKKAKKKPTSTLEKIASEED